MIATLLMLAPAPQTAGLPLPALDDAALLAIVRSRFDPSKADFVHPARALGTHKGVPVVADYVCSDLCPDYTRRIIRYDLPAGTSCAQAGGVSKDIAVPKVLGMGSRRYCVPMIAPYQR